MRILDSGGEGVPCENASCAMACAWSRVSFGLDVVESDLPADVSVVGAAGFRESLPHAESNSERIAAPVATSVTQVVLRSQYGE